YGSSEKERYLDLWGRPVRWRCPVGHGPHRCRVPGPRRRGGGTAPSPGPDLRRARHRAHDGPPRLPERGGGGRGPLLRGDPAAGAKSAEIGLTSGDVKTKVKFCLCWRSSGVEQLPCKQWVRGSNPLASASFWRGSRRRPEDSGRYPSGQRGQTVNLLANAFGGSNPPLPTTAGAVVVGVGPVAGPGPDRPRATTREERANNAARE